MLSEEQFLSWGRKLKLSPQACELISRIRSSQPSRRVQSGRGNVSGRYPSRKMSHTIQFESHQNELLAILDFEHDPDVLEYFDQPEPIKLRYESKTGRLVGALHTPDYFVIRKDRAGWEECKMETELIKLAEASPGRYRKDREGEWWCPPGECVAEKFGFYYHLRSSKENNLIYCRNVRFLEDFFRTSSLLVAEEVRKQVISIVSSEFGLRLNELLQRAESVATADNIYTLIAVEDLYADLHAAPLAEPDRVAVFVSKEAALAHVQLIRGPRGIPTKPRLVDVSVGMILNWDDRTWRIANVGTTKIGLLGEGDAFSEILLSAFEELVRTGRIVGAAKSDSHEDSEIKARLAAAGERDYQEASRRQALVIAYLNREPLPEGSVSDRTIRTYVRQYQMAEAQFGAGYLGLLPRKQARGNRNRKLPESTQEMIAHFIESQYETLKQKSKQAAYAALVHACDQQGVIAPSYRTFILEIRKRPRHVQILKRQGKRAAYQQEPVYWELSLTTPRHGDRPFEIGHIDHTEMDIELVCSRTGRNLGRPWATILTDAYSRRFLAVYLTFDPPSYRSCMMILRECVRLRTRLPQIIVVDNGSEFNSTYFEAFLALYECTKKSRPPAKPRFGSVCERLFGTTNTQFVHNLQGNTQITRNVRQVTKSVNPQKQAIWTLEKLHTYFCEYAYEVYDQTDHPALGQSPREAFTSGLARTGMRSHRLIPYDETFLMATLPSTPKGTAKVLPGQGVKINYIYYWCEAFRSPEVEGTQVPVRYDPYNAGIAYAYVGKQWVQCHSEYHGAFFGRSEKEILLATRELHRQKQLHSSNSSITVRRLANFLESTEAEENLLKQRLRDREFAVILGAISDNQGTEGYLSRVVQRRDSSSSKDVKVIDSSTGDLNWDEIETYEAI